MTQWHTAPSRRGGFSLIELAFSLAIVGLLGVLLWQFAPRLKSLPAIAALTGTTLDRAETALNGYILANGRLPCPDTSAGNTGNEDCTNNASVGWLPVRTLGLSLAERVRYGVYRAPSGTPSLDADLATISNRYQPFLPDMLDKAEPVYTNPLDFCVGLRNQTAAGGGTTLTAGALQVPLSYGLAVAGAGDRDNLPGFDGKPSLFDGLNATATRFELAGKPVSAIYDDVTRTVGSSELFARLGCASRLAAVNVAARGAYASYDLDQVALLYQRFRIFQVKIAELNKQAADTAQTLAIADMALSVASAAHAATGTFETFGAAAATIVLSTAAIGLAGKGLIDALADVKAAEADLEKARQQKEAADNFKVLTGADMVAAVSYLGALDQKGILP